jgi:hypothetical protein
MMYLIRDLASIAKTLIPLKGVLKRVQLSWVRHFTTSPSSEQPIFFIPIFPDFSCGLWVPWRKAWLHADFYLN